MVYARWYDLTRQVLLKAGSFNFSIIRKVLPKSLEVTPFGEEALYKKPADYLKLLSFYDGNTWQAARYKRHYTVEGENLLLTGVFSGNSSGLNVRYVKDFTVVTKMDPNFQMALAYALASKVCYKFKRSQAEVESLRAHFKDQLMATLAIDAQESPIKVIKALDLIPNQRTMHRDPRYYE